MPNLFVYGTLQNDEVVKALTMKKFKKLPCKLNDHIVYCVKNEQFPGMIKSKNDSTEGFVLLDIDNESLKIITFWEGESYIPKSLTILIDGKNVKVITYIWKNKDLLSKSAWNNDTYRTTHMSDCISKCIPDAIPLIHRS